MSDTNVFGQSTPDARIGLRARYDQLEALPESKERRHKSERLHGISQSVSILALVVTLLAGLLAIFSAILEAIGHPGLLATGALVGGAALLALLPGAGVLSALDRFNFTFSKVYPGITEDEVEAILANIKASEAADRFRTPSDLAERRAGIIAANTRPATGAVLVQTIKNALPVVLIPALLSLPLLAVAFGLIVAPLAWLLMGAYALLWIVGCFLAFAITFGAN